MTTIFLNGRIFSATQPQQQDEPSFAEAMIVRDGLIAYIGSASDPAVHEARAAAGGATTQDLQGKIVVPGFIDGHMHLFMMGQALTGASLEHCKNLDDIRAALQAHAQANPGLPRIIARGWMRPMTDGQATAAMLDGVDPRPIFIESKDLHTTWCNSAALAEMGIDENTEDVPGGTIERDAARKPTGALSEAPKMKLVWPHLTNISSTEERLTYLRAAFREYSSAGYTGLVEMAMNEVAWGALQELRARDGDPPVRVAAHWLINPTGDDAANVKQVERAIELHRQFNAQTSPGCRIAGIKVVCDGIVDGCTALLAAPFSHNGAQPAGIWTRDSLRPVVRAAAAAGVQIALHAIGDAAITMALDALEAAAREHALLRPRIEHLELCSAADAKRLGALGITASIQPVHADPAILREWPRLLGEDRCKRAFAYKDLLDHGAKLALGTDAPTAPHKAFGNWYTATTRRSAREPASTETVNEHFKLSLAATVAAQTAGAAYSCYADEIAGRLEKGLQADFVVLDVEWDPVKLLRGEVAQTWFGGRKVFDAEEAGRTSSML